MSANVPIKTEEVILENVEYQSTEELDEELQMTASTGAKRSRASTEQLSRMVDFFLENPGLAEGKFQKLHGKYESEKKWNELTKMLNGYGRAVKTVEQWRTVWRDLKSRTSIKFRDRKKQQALTKNRLINQEPITELERQVIVIIGSDYIEGHESVAENVPMEEELQLRLEDGDEDVSFEMSSRSRSPKEAVELQAPRRVMKRKHVEDDSDTQNKFLEIANKQADALKLLAECSAASVEANKMMANAIQMMGEGLKASADAINNLAQNLIKRSRN